MEAKALGAVALREAEIRAQATLTAAIAYSDQALREAERALKLAADAATALGGAADRLHNALEAHMATYPRVQELLNELALLEAALAKAHDSLPRLPFLPSAQQVRDFLFVYGKDVVDDPSVGTRPRASDSNQRCQTTASVLERVSNDTKYAMEADQSAPELLFGVCAKSNDSTVAFGLHFLASDAIESGDTWGYGRSYLLLLRKDPDHAPGGLYLQLYESVKGTELRWVTSTLVSQREELDQGIRVEALYQRQYEILTLFVDSEALLTVPAVANISEGETIALRSFLGEVEFTDVYVRQR